MIMWVGAPLPESGAISIFITISPIFPEVVDHSSQYASFPLAVSFPTTANSIVVLLPSSAVDSYCAPDPTVGVKIPIGIEGRMPIPICALAVVVKTARQKRQAAATLRLFIDSPILALRVVNPNSGYFIAAGLVDGFFLRR
jgi:hypothetical protein